MRFELTVVAAIVALFPAGALPPQHGMAGSIQNASRGTGRSPGTSVKLKPSLPQPNWLVQYVSGSLAMKSDQWVRIAFVPRSASGDTANTSVRVPAEELVTVEFNAKTEKESALLQGPRSGCSYARSMMPDTTRSRPEVLVAMAASPSSASRFAERLRSKHMVHFLWNEEGVQKSMSVKVNDCEYQSLIANIRWITGSHWQAIERESKK